MNSAYSTDSQYIHPSILNADFMRIGEELDRISTADSVHVDVMDNNFVPNITFGASSVTVHLEAAKAPVRRARALRRKNAAVGVALRPATPVEPLLDVIGEFDLLLLMTVEPGFGGQSFLESMLPKIRRARSAISE